MSIAPADKLTAIAKMTQTALTLDCPADYLDRLATQMQRRYGDAEREDAADELKRAALISECPTDVILAIADHLVERYPRKAGAGVANAVIGRIGCDQSA